jgi:hypothetical protein
MAKSVRVTSNQSPSKKDPLYSYIRETVKSATAVKTAAIDDYWVSRVVEDTFDPNKFDLICYYIFRKLGKIKSQSPLKIIKLLCLCYQIQLAGSPKFFEELAAQEHLILYLVEHRPSKNKHQSKHLTPRRANPQKVQTDLGTD